MNTNQMMKIMRKAHRAHAAKKVWKDEEADLQTFDNLVRKKAQIEDEHRKRGIHV